MGRRIIPEQNPAVVRRQQLKVPQNRLRHESVPIGNPANLVMMDEPIVLTHLELEEPGVGVVRAEIIVNPVHVFRKTLIWVRRGLMRRWGWDVEPRTRERRSRPKPGATREGLQRTGRARRERKNR
jgi:hypothetical protein